MSDMHMHPASAPSTAPGRSDSLVHVRTNERTDVQPPKTPRDEKAVEGNARVASRLAYRKDCDGCGQEIAMVVCRDDRWRPFETHLIAAAPIGVWAGASGMAWKSRT